MTTLQDWYLEVPLITRVYLTGSMLTTAACSLELISPFSLFFNFRLVFVKLQVRRGLEQSRAWFERGGSTTSPCRA